MRFGYCVNILRCLLEYSEQGTIKIMFQSRPGVKQAHSSISYTAALSALQETAKRISSSFEEDEELVPLVDAVGRICKRDYRSPQSMPAYDTSAMDGFAVCSRLTTNASPSTPIYLRPDGIIAAGDQPVTRSSECREGLALVPCVEIMTGAPFPISTTDLPFDACIRIEDTIMEETSLVDAPLYKITKPVLPNQNRRFAGTDFDKDDTIVGRGATVSAQHVMALASMGISEILVYRKLRVAILSTGSELLSYRRHLDQSHHIRDSNGPYLQAALKQLGVKANYLGIMEDDQEQLGRTIEHNLAMQSYDMFITTGAVSVGKFDFVRKALEDLRANVVFHGVAMRPGHPVLFATVPCQRQRREVYQDSGSYRQSDLNGTSSDLATIPFFGLPGNPLATAACFRFLVLPYLRLLEHQPEEVPVAAQVNLAHDAAVKKPSHLRVFRHGRMDGCAGRVLLHDDQSSSKMRPLLSANCWAVAQEGCDLLSHGDWMDCFPIMPSSLGTRDIVGFGSPNIGLI